MKRFVDRLEGGYRVIRIRRIRRYVYFILTLITISFVLAIMVANGGSLRPFYLPLDIVVGVVLVMVVVWLSLTLIFRNLRIRYATRGSQKFLMARNSMSKGLLLIIVCTIVGVLFVTPFFHSLTEDQLSSEQSQSVSSGLDKEVNFWNMDNLGLTRTREISLVVENHDVNVCFLEGDYVNGSECDSETTIPKGGNKTYSLPQTGYRMFSIVLNNTSPTPSQIQLRAKNTISENLLAIVPLTMFIIVILNAIWISFLYPVRKKFATASIYSRDYVEKVGGDVEVYARRLPSRRRARVEAAAPPAEIPEAVPTAEAEAEVPLAEEIVRPPPPPPEAEIPPPPDMIDIPYLFEQAKERVASGEFEEAVKFYDDILEREPDSIAAMIGKGTALVSLGKEDETILCMDEVLEADPRNKAALLWIAKIFESKHNWEEALKWHDRYLGIYPGDENQWIKHGDVLVNVGREDIAIESYRNALKINPQNEEAIQKLEKLKISVQDIMTQALSRSTLGDYIGALELFNRVLRIEPGNARALLGKGVAYRRLKKIDSAIECLNEVLEVDPDNQAALLNKGGLLEGQGRWEEALYCYNRLVEMNPEDEEAWVKKGDVHLNLGMREEALGSYREALDINPQDQDVMERCGVLEEELEEVLQQQRAIEQLSKLKGISVKRATLLYDAGFETINDLSQASINKLKSIRGISRKTARMILDSVRAKAEQFSRELNKIPGVGPSLSKAIVEQGFSSIDQIRSSSPEELSRVKGISKKKAEKIIDHLSR